MLACRELGRDQPLGKSSISWEAAGLLPAVDSCSVPAITVLRDTPFSSLGVSVLVVKAPGAVALVV